MMGLFESMLGHKAKDAAQTPGVQERFTQLKGKYQSVLQIMEQRGVRLQNLHVENDKLFIKGTVTSPEIKNTIWEQVKRVDAGFSDLTLDLEVSPSAAGVGGSGGGMTGSGATAQSGMQTYTVKPGDSLSKIAQQYYGDAKAYTRIFEANRDILQNPDLIQPGQQLKIPKA